MNLTVQSAADLLRLEVGEIKSAPLMLRLFVNDITPHALTVAADLVEPGAAAGYVPRVLDGPWTFDDALPVHAKYAPVKFTFRNPVGLVYGYYFTREERIARVKRFASPIDIKREGDTIEITPDFTQDNRS